MPPVRSRFLIWLAAASASVLAVGLAAPCSVLAAAGPSQAQLKELEVALKAGGTGLSSLLERGPGLDPTLVELRRRALLKQFPDASWTLTPGPSLKDGRSTVQLQLSGTHTQGSTIYRLQASQLLSLTTSGGKITGQAVIREQSLLRSGAEDVAISLLIPDAVLTGQRYDVDVVFDEPLDGAVVAGGLVALSAQQTSALMSPTVQLGALGGGGLFKTVQAPYSPGEQTWAVLLVHPKGIVSATKRVRVVADRSQLNP